MGIIGIISKHAAKSYDKILKEKLAKITREPLFWNDSSKGYISISELAGYEYISFTLVNPIEIKTSVGITISFIAESDT